MTSYQYSPSTKGFYIKGVHSVIPEDAISITETEYQNLMSGQTQGKQIVYKARKIQLVSGEAEVLTWDQIRKYRNTKLRDSDWTQLADTALSADQIAQWQEYRQALRDLTEKFTNPTDIVWPMVPGSEEA